MKAKRVKKLDPEAPLILNAARIVSVRLGELRGFVPEALEPGSETAQHDMRIAAKRLRYVLEATEFCFGAPAEKARKRARDLQEVLGDLHDCDVMAPRAEAEIARLRREDAESVRALAGDAADLDPVLVAGAPHRTAYRGLEILTVHLRARRMLLFDRFVALWGETEEQGVWTALEEEIDRRVALMRERLLAARRAAAAANRLAEAREAERAAADRAERAAAELADARRRGL